MSKPFVSGITDMDLAMLKRGQLVKIRPNGKSMEPRIKSGQLVTVDPHRPAEVGDVVLARTTEGKILLHKIHTFSSLLGGAILTNEKGVGGDIAREILGTVTQIED
jgi:SOS-response transcriptional repressor LexA